MEARAPGASAPFVPSPFLTQAGGLRLSLQCETWPRPCSVIGSSSTELTRYVRCCVLPASSLRAHHSARLLVPVMSQLFVSILLLIIGKICRNFQFCSCQYSTGPSFLFVEQWTPRCSYRWNSWGQNTCVYIISHMWINHFYSPHSTLSFMSRDRHYIMHVMQYCHGTILKCHILQISWKMPCLAEKLKCSYKYFAIIYPGFLF